MQTKVYTDIYDKNNDPTFHYLAQYLVILIALPQSNNLMYLFYFRVHAALISIALYFLFVFSFRVLSQAMKCMVISFVEKVFMFVSSM